MIPSYGSLFFALRLLAGTWNLPFFWTVVAIPPFVSLTAIRILEADLIAERIHPRGKDTDPAARFVLTILCLLHYGLAALDLGRWHYLDGIPLLLQVFSFVPVIAGWLGLLWSMKVNKFFSSAIRIQQEREQKVISSGPYACVRHPGYAFAGTAFLFQAVAMGSWLSMLPAILMVFYLIYRIRLEEQLLLDGLPGYKDYVRKVRFRLIPGLW